MTGTHQTFCRKSSKEDGTWKVSALNDIIKTILDRRDINLWFEFK